MNSPGGKKIKLCAGTADFGGVPDERFIVLAGNPNVGKSTIFNALTGLHQHTGNWSGKTVATSCGNFTYDNVNYTVADIPGCYSLKAHSAEESCAADVIRSKSTDGVVVVCDANAIERNLNLVLQICEICTRVVVALNFADDARKKGVVVDTNKLSHILGIPVVTVNARKKLGIYDAIRQTDFTPCKKIFRTDYGSDIENATKNIITTLKKLKAGVNERYLALRLLEDDSVAWQHVSEYAKKSGICESAVHSAVHESLNTLSQKGISPDDIKDIIAITLVRTSHRICRQTVRVNAPKKKREFSRADKFITGKYTGFSLMLALLALVFFITVKGANIPSDFLMRTLFSLEKPLLSLCRMAHLPEYLSNVLVLGGYRVLAWVVSVMLPPMAIFFPLFTILEDVGYLPRVAFNLDKCFKKCSTCGKQALTTCMGLGCNAAGVTGARIIDSPREKIIAILTNSFVPCNGRFPGMLTIISVFFSSSTLCGGLVSGIYMSLFVVFAIAVSLVASKLLSLLFLKGVPSSFALELPSYRRPQFGQIIVRSVLDRTVFVLARAAAVAFPAGIVIYLLSNFTVGGTSVINCISSFLNPLGLAMGMDGVILTAFIFGLPANEIVLPLALMMYTQGGVLTQNANFDSIYSILASNGWNKITALCCVLFFIMHWPCSTTLLTIKKETGSFKWSALAFLLPVSFGVVICMLVNLLSEIPW